MLVTSWEAMKATIMSTVGPSFLEDYITSLEKEIQATASANLQKTFRSLYQLVQARKVGKVARVKARSKNSQVISENSCQSEGRVIKLILYAPKGTSSTCRYPDLGTYCFLMAVIVTDGDNDINHF